MYYFKKNRETDNVLLYSVSTGDIISDCDRGLCKVHMTFPQTLQNTKRYIELR